MTSPAGFTAGAVACGLKTSGLPDLALIVSAAPCQAAGLFTTNCVAAAPVQVTRQTLARWAGAFRAVVVNAGNANACTGDQGMADAQAMQRLAAASLACEPEAVLVMSTGVIGVPLAMDRVSAGIRDAAHRLSRDGGAAAARAIMTTDTRPKEIAAQVRLPGGVVTIGGMAKGAGMIHPDLATMLALITTDAQLPAGALPGLLKEATALSFNRISIDGDTSTNDTVLLLANGASGVAVAGPDRRRFAAALTDVCVALAQAIVRDGEGARRFVTIRVSGAGDNAAAHRVANAIATSPLVKTAFAGGDPNWGRILAAAGRAGVAFDQRAAALWIGRDGDALQLLASGTPLPFREEDAAGVFADAQFSVHLRLGAGPGEAVVWTCDLTHEYVTINADYRT